METQRPSDQPGRWIGQTLPVEIDRPLGSRHPRFDGMRYEVNYGFVPGTRAADGHEIDAYVLGVDGPVDRFEGVCIAIIRREDDREDKLVVAPGGCDFSNPEIMRQVRFQERFFRAVLLR